MISTADKQAVNADGNNGAIFGAAFALLGAAVVIFLLTLGCALYLCWRRQRRRRRNSAASAAVLAGTVDVKPGSMQVVQVVQALDVPVVATQAEVLQAPTATIAAFPL